MKNKNEVIEIEIDFNKQKQMDLKPKEDKKRQRYEEYDYDDDFLERFEGDDQLIDLDCDIENFFIYKGDMETTDIKRMARKYKYQEKKDMNNTFEFENKLTKYAKKDKKFHNVVNFLVYQELKKSNMDTFGVKEYLMYEILRERQFFEEEKKKPKTEKPETENNKVPTNNVPESNPDKDIIDLTQPESKEESILLENTQFEATQNELTQNKTLENTEKEEKEEKPIVFDDVTATDLLENIQKNSNFKTFEKEEIEKYLEELKQEIINQHEELKQMLADVKNYTKNFKNFNYKTEGFTAKAIDFIINYCIFYYTDKGETLRSKVIVIIKKLFAEECTNKRVKNAICQKLEKDGFTTDRICFILRK